MGSEMKYYQIRNKKLNEIYQYSKIKKELKDGQNEDNNKERHEEKKTTA